MTVNKNRRVLLQGALAAAVVGTATTLAKTKDSSFVNDCSNRQPAPKTDKYWLTNVQLETGFKRNGNEIISTTTETVCLLINSGKIERIEKSAVSIDNEVPQHDMLGLLALPSFADMHVHLDKGFYGGPWQATTNLRSVQERIQEEKRILPSMVDTIPSRANALIDLITSFGTTFLRVHTNVDSTIKLQNVEKVSQALKDASHKVDYEIVAFPQHGLLADGAGKLMEQSLQRGCTIVGGVDPVTIDGDVDRSLGLTMDIATKYNVPIDIHLHNRGDIGSTTIKKLVRLAEEANWQNKITISHAFCLVDYKGSELEDLLVQMASVGMSVKSAVSVEVGLPPPKELAKYNIPMELGTDSINDLWSSYGSGSILERASIMGQWQGWNDEYSLNRTLKYITRGMTPLDDSGIQVWPKIGDEATFTFTTASCSAELIARRNPAKAVFKQGIPSVWDL